MSAPGSRVVLSDPRKNVSRLVFVLAVLAGLCAWSAVVLGNAWRYALGGCTVLLAAVVVLILVQMRRDAGYTLYVDSRGLVAAKNGREDVLPGELFERFELVYGGPTSFARLVLRYRRGSLPELPKLLRQREMSPGRLSLAILDGGESGASMEDGDLHRLRAFVKENGMGEWPDAPSPR
ncbi:hypothetical protein [Actinomadura parmotrematis]|uniref:PH domain-containing protein n=1 Tax=Actinomadura parmotrematis TaxID=2864039 RepID=A0ABS7FL84_9ACTN|nr:hypothetical protein [Actinomadura parmotrematis]MBW8481126.1 hypothetical protein [Actinomadura parmotrematis]